MKRTGILILGVLLALAAASVADAEIIRELEFYESMEALASDEPAVLENMAEEEVAKEVTHED